MKDNLKDIWKQRFNDWKKSGLSKSKWCAQNNLNIHQLYYWFKRFKTDENKQPTEIKWLPVQMETNVTEIIEHDSISVQIGKCNIDVKPGFDTEHLSKIIKVLNSLC